MAEESSRPAAEDSEEEEEGEEAAEAPVREEMKKAAKAPVREEMKKVAFVKQEDQQKAGVAATPPVKEEKSSPVRASPPPAASGPRTARPGASRPDSKPEPPTSPSTTAGMNLFANDGSFLELFKKKMEASSAGTKEDTKPEPDKRKPVSFVGKRRGGAKLALKTGMVAKKPKAEEEEEVVTQKGGAWAQYMAEVKKYKAHQCSDDDKTRPLVK